MNRLDLVVGPTGRQVDVVELTLAPLLVGSQFVNADEIAKQRWPDDPKSHAYEAAALPRHPGQAHRAGSIFIAETCSPTRPNGAHRHRPRSGLHRGSSRPAYPRGTGRAARQIPGARRRHDVPKPRSANATNAFGSSLPRQSPGQTQRLSTTTASGKDRASLRR